MQSHVSLRRKQTLRAEVNNRLKRSGKYCSYPLPGLMPSRPMIARTRLHGSNKDNAFEDTPLVRQRKAARTSFPQCHLTAPRAWCKQCLPGRWKRDVFRPGIVGMRGSMVLRLRTCMAYVNSPPRSSLYIGWVGVHWQRHCKTCRSLRELDNQGTVFFVFVFLAVAHSWLSSYRSFVRGK